MKKHLFISLLFVLPCGLAMAQNTLKVLSWNIYMLPKGILHTGKGPRAKLIGQQLKNSDYDVIVFQEAFHGGARRKIKRELKANFPYAVGPANRNPWWFKTSSGIWIVSKLPMKKLGTIDFKECKGADCWARKGALLVETEKAGQKFQVLGTHLEAGGPESIREGQYKELGGLLDKFQQENTPQIVCGDFNTETFDTLHYNMMLRDTKCLDDTLCGEQKFTDDAILNDFHRGRTHQHVIDFILFRGNGYAVKSMKRYVKMFTHQWKEDNDDLSDHFAVEAIIEF